MNSEVARQKLGIPSELTLSEGLVARRAAEEFAYHLRGPEGRGWAMSLPEDWYKMSDAQIRYALSLLPGLRVRRVDYK